MSAEGFAEFCEHHDFEWRSPNEFRNRFVIKLIADTRVF